MTELNLHAAAVLAAMSEAGQPPLDALDPITARLAFHEAILAMQGAAPAIGAVQPIIAGLEHGSVPLRLYRPPEPTAPLSPAIVYFHGGGFVLGNLDTYDVLCRRLCAASRCVVVSVDYRLAPEHPFPAGLDDARGALRWLAAQAERLAIDPHCLCLAGDSAGANLATVVARELAEDPSLRIQHQLLLYPVVDLSRESAGYETLGEGYFLTADLMRYFRAHYLRSDAEAMDGRVSPLLAGSFSNMPSATLLLCGFDPLCEEGKAYGRALEEAGVAVETVCLDDQIHGFLLMDGVIPEAGAAIVSLGERVGRLLRENMAASS